MGLNKCLYLKQPFLSHVGLISGLLLFVLIFILCTACSTVFETCCIFTNIKDRGHWKRPDISEFSFSNLIQPRDQGWMRIKLKTKYYNLKPISCLTLCLTRPKLSNLTIFTQPYLIPKLCLLHPKPCAYLTIKFKLKPLNWALSYRLFWRIFI